MREQYSVSRRPGRWVVSGLVVVTACVAVVGLVRWKEKRRQATAAPPQEVAAIKVQVLNACGEPGLAQKVRDFFMKFQVDVRETGNAGYMLPESVVLDRIGDRLRAGRIARLMGLPDDRVIQQLNRALVDIDVTILIGKDYRKYFTSLPQE
jgi:hypothetical protein